MTTTNTIRPSHVPPAPPSPAPRRFTRDEYHQIADLGIFLNERLELLDGEIIRKSPPAKAPKPRLFTRAEYNLMAEHGLFPNERLELIDGEIITMSPHNNPHAATIAWINTYLFRRLPPTHFQRVQLPLAIDAANQPEPDFAIIRGDPERLGPDHPSTALLVIEVSHSTLAIDRKKARLYALARVPDYWILDLNSNRLELHRSPVDDTYTSRTVLSFEDSVTPLAFPDLTIPVQSLFPHA
jgi:Uma2 family endonuclease